jgi:hypothetical protein
LERKEKPNSKQRKGNKVITQTEITLEKNETGGLVITALVSGYLVTRHYYYYTKREAARLFLNEINGKKEATK